MIAFPSHKMRSGAVAAAVLLGGIALPGTAAQAVASGAAAASGSYPFVAFLDTGERSCSGVLVHADLILTAKSCFGALPAVPGPPPSPTTATIGRTDLTQNTGVRVAVTEVTPHPTLNVVVGRLASPVDIAPVAIATAPVAGETLRIAGYGRTATDWVPDRLHTAAVQVDAVTDGGFSIATGSGPVTTCQGDAGGPALRAVDGRVELVGLHDGGKQGGCHGASGTERDAVEIRADRLHDWVRQQMTVPQPVDEMSRNLAADAAFTASSSAPDSWGWSLRQVNDGNRVANGWSSWSQTETDHAEWLEFAFPAARRLSRVDLYPRVDVPGGSFPANFTVSVWTGSAWDVVVSRANFANPGTSPVRLPFPAVTGSKVRIEGTKLKLMQFSEVEAYLSGNLAADATFTASSSAPDSWGWSLRQVNDGHRELNGWSSWSQTETDHTEWLELAFPSPREVNRLELYPRVDVPGGSFPANFTVSAWTGSAWETVVTKRNFPNPGVAPVRLPFPGRTASKLRIEGTDLRLMQFSEVEAYNLYPTPPIAAPVRLPSLAEERDYPDAAGILARHGLKLFKGDGHILFVTSRRYDEGQCALGEIQVEKALDVAPFGLYYCFRTIGGQGYVTLQVPGTFGVRGGSRALEATAEMPGGEKKYAIAANGFVAIDPGTGDEAPKAVLVELRLTGGN